MASPENRHCANCIGALSFPMTVGARNRLWRILMGLQLRYEHDSSTIRARFERDTTSYEELCAFEQ